jgi:hypothetical protein
MTNDNLNPGVNSTYLHFYVPSSFVLHMANQPTFFERLGQIVPSIAVMLIGAYGTWDLVIKPLVQVDQAPTQACATLVMGVMVEKPAKPGTSAKKASAPEGLPLVVPAGEKRIISIEVDNPDDKPVVYTWKATYGQFSSRVTTDNQATYTAPTALVNDKITVEVRLQGCSMAQRTVTIAVVPSAGAPLPDPTLPNPTNSPIFDPLAPLPASPPPIPDTKIPGQ